ncbi:transposase [Undibacterium seohonense]|uniref:Transposase n=1 Tax=Undibacterium seohonense TaxID=1344950 RepID=A0ABR6X0N8_9BURK|nr:transposase [Undibacterium seohonense]MBC3806436.1 transposase [Undibacterium seohonense]
MSRYRRSLLAGGTYFFTVVTYRRQAILCDEMLRNALRSAIESVRASRPFTIDAWVLLPDHLHCIWTLPEGDADFSARWMMIKRKVSIACAAQYKRAEWLTASKQKHRESTIWQRRFWEHQIRDDEDYTKHLDYLHYNPVKHGLINQAKDWQYSSFHRYAKSGLYDENWERSIDLS